MAVDTTIDTASALGANTDVTRVGGRAAGRAAGGAAAITPKQRREQAQHRHGLRRLGAAVAEFRASLEQVRAATAALHTIGQSRPLTRDEVVRLRALRRESDRLRFELQQLYQEFALLRRPPPAS